MFPVPYFSGHIGDLIVFLMLWLVVFSFLLFIVILIFDYYGFFKKELRKSNKKIRTLTYIPFVLGTFIYGDCVYDGISSYNQECHDANPQVAAQKYTLIEKMSDGIDIYNKVSNVPLRFYLEEDGDKAEIKTGDVSVGSSSSTSDLDTLKESSVNAEHDSFNGIKIEEEVTYGKDNTQKHWKIWNRSKTPVCMTRPEISCENSNLAHVINPGKYGEF